MVQLGIALENICNKGDDPHRVSRCYIISLELCESAESVVLIHPLGRMRTEKYVNGELIMLSNCKIHLRL